MTTVHHRYSTVSGRRLFYREAGPSDGPAVVLLHGFPTSSFMFRDLIPRLADRFHVVAPDHLGFGFSDTPPIADFAYTFDSLADLTAALLHQLGVWRYAMYVHDYGAPIGWRLALKDPASVLAIITQNGNAYESGFGEAFWKPVRKYWLDQNQATETSVRQALTLDAIMWQYLHGVRDETLVSPDTWFHDYSQVSRPGNDLVQLQLLVDYANNLQLYPKVHAYLRESHVPLLAVWGSNDEIFVPAGALAFPDDAPGAEVHLLGGGHFLLESHLDATTALVRDFLERTLS
jgi:pimeloyl-ACP methyl ester carboxylesterase